MTFNGAVIHCRGLQRPLTQFYDDGLASGMVVIAFRLSSSFPRSLFIKKVRSLSTLLRHTVGESPLANKSKGFLYAG